MKNFFFIPIIPLMAFSMSCRSGLEPEDAESGGTRSLPGSLSVNPESVAALISALPLSEENIREVNDAVSSSSDGGFDEEYTFSDIFLRPGSGVGEGTRAATFYSSPLRELISDYVHEYAATKAGPSGGDFDPENYLEQLTDSELQLYFPYHDEVDSNAMPVVTFDPGYGAETNYGYEITVGADGSRKVQKVLVDEVLARERPVWVVNTNDDSAFSPLDFYKKTEKELGRWKTQPFRTASPGPAASPKRKLLLKSFRMLRNYDSWFAGASEFKIQLGSVDGFKASTDAELALYYPSITDLVIVVKRKYVDVELPYDAILMTDFTSQQDKLAFLLTEDDGGTNTSWKCSATVKYQSKAYGFDIDIPYKDKDDIVWRGQLDADFFREEDIVSARFGDVILKFSLE